MPQNTDIFGILFRDRKVIGEELQFEFTFSFPGVDFWVDFACDNKREDSDRYLHFLALASLSGKKKT